MNIRKESLIFAIEGNIVIIIQKSKKQIYDKAS